MALAVYGCLGTLLQLLGSMHRHVPVQSPGPQQVVAADPVRDGLGWLVGRWREWQAYAHEQAHAGGLFVHAHEHRHDDFERHHHTPSGDIVALGAQEGGAGGPGDLGSSAGAGSTTLPLGLATALLIAAPPARQQRWARDRAQAWRSAPRRRLERPPRWSCCL